MSDWLKRKVDELIGAKPRMYGAESVMRKEHDRWLRTAQLHRKYWGEDAEYTWVWDGIGGPIWPVCSHEWEFVERRPGFLYDANGRSSWDAWSSCGPKGLTTIEPPMPGRPTQLHVKGTIGDDSRKWTLDYSYR